jgi:hypothetical protein
METFLACFKEIPQGLQEVDRRLKLGHKSKLRMKLNVMLPKKMRKVVLQNVLVRK